MVEATLVEIIKDNKLLLIRAIRGISKSKWNGPGGKIQPGETPEQCIIRETLEETGLTISNLFYHGLLTFHNAGENENALFSVHLFSTKKFSGTPTRQAGEGELSWFNLEELPMGDMWADDQYWIPHMLKMEKFDAEFYFDSNKNIIRHEINVKS